jgi:hypothetical protein
MMQKCPLRRRPLLYNALPYGREGFFHSVLRFLSSVHGIPDDNDCISEG